LALDVAQPSRQHGCDLSSPQEEAKNKKDGPKQTLLRFFESINKLQQISISSSICFRPQLDARQPPVALLGQQTIAEDL
jgi:hypothetical protein